MNPVYLKEDLDYLASRKSNTVFSKVPPKYRTDVMSSILNEARDSVFISVHDLEHVDDLSESFYIRLYGFVACHPNRFCDWIRRKKTKCLTIEVYNLEALENTRFLKTIKRLSAKYPGKVSIEEIPFKKECTILVSDDTRYFLSQTDGFIFCFNKPIVAKRIREYNSIAAGNTQNFSSLAEEF